MKQILLAFQFLTIIPLRVKGDISEEEMSQSAAFFPFVGVFQGLLAVLSALLLSKVFPSEIVSGLIILVLIISNGGFHIDGVADTFDALSVKSSGNETTYKEKRLSVMKDSSTGAIGVVAIVISILLKFLFINSILLTSTLFTAYGLLFLMPVFSKWAMNTAIFHGISARQNGLGKIFIDSTGAREFLLATAAVVCSMVGALSFMRFSSSYLQFLLLSLFILYVISFSATRFFNKKFSGLTGDTLGAISEITEIIFLLMVVAWSRLSI